LVTIGVRPLFERARSWRLAFAGLAVLLVLCEVAQYRAFAGPIEDGVLQPEFQQLVAFCRHHVPSQDVMVFWNPRVLVLYTGGHATTYSPEADDVENWRQFQVMKVRFIAINARWPEDGLLQKIVQEHPDRLREIYRNPIYTVYEMI